MSIGFIIIYHWNNSNGIKKKSLKCIYFCNTVAPDLCSNYNGGCHHHAKCNQTGLIVNCTCHTDYNGDGFSCEPVNRLVRPFAPGLTSHKSLSCGLVLMWTYSLSCDVRLFIPIQVHRGGEWGLQWLCLLQVHWSRELMSFYIISFLVLFCCCCFFAYVMRNH